MKQIVRIIPPDIHGDGPYRARGTKVMVGETEIPFVSKVEISAEADGLWKATIHCHIMPLHLEGVEADIIQAAVEPVEDGSPVR